MRELANLMTMLKEQYHCNSCGLPRQAKLSWMQVMCLARALRLRDAYSAIAEVRRRRVPQGEEVPFGQVINSPMAAGAPLTVVHPHEGCRVSRPVSSSCFSSLWLAYRPCQGNDVVHSLSLIRGWSLLVA